ncbi:hypothetical protein QYF36_013802 [Acer negundo]|nr:hypothetical protein QYF36_013802 [Acer negundo]
MVNGTEFLSYLMLLLSILAIKCKYIFALLAYSCMRLFVGYVIMSNGIYKSPMHRVVTNTEKLRISVASFIEPDPDNEIGPVEHLIDEQRLRLYRNVKNYGIINYECYQKRLVALETVQV